jgi:hypothetical protein
LVLQRAQIYHWQGQNLQRIWLDGHVWVVPYLALQKIIMRRAHEKLGHFGVYWTCRLFQGQYWWKGM